MSSIIAVPASPTDKRSLHHIWSERKAEYLLNPNGAFQLARKANSAGEHLLALEIVECVLGTSQVTDRISLLQQKALALARMAATDQALQTLEQIRSAGGVNAETFGLLGRVYKDLAEANSDKEEERRLFYAKSQEFYQAGFEHTQDTYCGINAAAVAVLTGQLELAKRLAAQTLDSTPQADPYFALATNAEAALILLRTEEAADFYSRACDIAAGRWADLVSTRKQCRLLAGVLYGRRDQFDHCFPVGTVALFAGHMIDGVTRPEPRFPATAESSIRERITAWTRDNAVRLSFSSAAAGSDLIFLSVAQSMGVETHVVLPFAAERFVETSVRPGGDRWVELFHRIMDHAASTTILNDDVADDASSAYDFTNRMIAAKAALRAATVELPIEALCVWDGLAGDGGGGTADAVAFWRQAKLNVHALQPLHVEGDGPIRGEIIASAVPFERTQTALPSGHRGTVCAMLHMYFEGYFTLHENQYPIFQRLILATLARVLAVTGYAPVGRYGFGADYVFVFDTPKAAGMFAIAALEAIADSLQTSDELVMTLPHLCLHAGPIQLMVNPVLNQYTHEGTNLTRAGRLGRNVSPGVAYCTEPFAALSALEAIREFRFEYAGTVKCGGDSQDRLFSVRYGQKTSLLK